MTYIHMGKQGEDIITGFKGTVTGFCIYISGCNQVLLTPKVKSDGGIEDGRWFDEQRISFAASKAVKLDNSKTPGPDLQAPVR